MIRQKLVFRSFKERCQGNQFLPRDAVHPRYYSQPNPTHGSTQPMDKFSVSVRLSVTSRCSTKTAKRRITQITPQGESSESSFLVPKISAKFDRGHPLRGHQMQVRWVKIGDFPQITGYMYISKTVQDRRMVSIKVE